MLELDTINPKETVTIQLVHPGTLKPLEASITVAGLAHPATLEARRVALDRMATAANQTIGRRQKKYGKATASDAIKPDEIEADTINALVTRTLSWEGITRHGEPIPFNEDEVRKLYTDEKTRWIREQVQEGITSDEDFFS